MTSEKAAPPTGGEERSPAAERLRAWGTVDWGQPSRHQAETLIVAGYRPTALLTLPIRPGTARRLGIHPPVDPALFLMQDRVNLMFWQLDFIAQAYGRPWRPLYPRRAAP